MKTTLQYEEKVPNDSHEEMEIECYLRENGGEQYTLRYAGGSDGNVKWPGMWVELTGEEMNQLFDIVQKFRSMKKLTLGEAA